MSGYCIVVANKNPDWDALTVYGPFRSWDRAADAVSDISTALHKSGDTGTVVEIRPLVSR